MKRSIHTNLLVHPWALTAFYWVLAVYFLFGACLGFARLWPALGQPFGGFIWQYDYALGSSVSYDTPRYWPATAAGLVPHTMILQVNGQPATAFAEIYHAAPAGTPIVYTIIPPGGTPQQVTAPLIVFTFGHLWDGYGMVFLAALSAAICGGILVQSSNEPAHRLFGFAMLLFSASGFYHSHNGNINSFNDARYATAFFWAPTPALLGAVFFHVAFAYPTPHHILRRYPWLLLVGYGIAALAGATLAVGLLFGFTAWGGQLQLQALYASMLILLIGMASTLVRGVLALAAPPSALGDAERRRVRVMAVVWLMTLLVLLGSVVAANLRLQTIFEFVSFACLLLPIGNVYALHNAEMVVQLERNQQLQAQLLDDLREVHGLQDRIIYELADELHDSALAESKALEMRLFALIQQMQHNPLGATWRVPMAQLHEHTILLNQTLRQIVEGAKPVDFANERFSEAVARTIGQFNAQTEVTRYTGAVEVSVDQAEVETLAELYWILRAALNNVRDHAHATTCHVSCHCVGSIIELHVIDNGCGAQMQPGTIRSDVYRRRFGLASMRSRAARLGGGCTINFREVGTQVDVQVPLRIASTAPTAALYSGTSEASRACAAD